MSLVEHIQHIQKNTTFQPVYADFWDQIIKILEPIDARQVEQMALHQQAFSFQSLSNESFQAACFFDLDHSLLAPYFKALALPVWAFVPLIPCLLRELMAQLNREDYVEYAPQVYVHKSVQVSKNAELHGPCIIEEDTEIRSSCYIRGNVLVGKGCVLGNSCEFKNAILFDQAAVPHYSYVGDSILGYKAHLGAGAITSNLKLDRQSIALKLNAQRLPLGLRKLGAIIGDACEIGCQSVLSPATFLGRGSKVYPLTHVYGYYQAKSYIKNKEQ